MAGRIPKNTVNDWIDAGQRMLVDEGIGGLKADRLASRLGVSRGGSIFVPSSIRRSPNPP